MEGRSPPSLPVLSSPTHDDLLTSDTRRTLRGTLGELVLPRIVNMRRHAAAGAFWFMRGMPSSVFHRRRTPEHPFLTTGHFMKCTYVCHIAASIGVFVLMSARARR